ncbi:MAG: NAD(+) synthase [Oscillospiraceae bacterium]
MQACHGKTAVIGISGGKDSSTVAALAVAAYGRENVYGVLMPDGEQPDIDSPKRLVEHLQIPHCTINIHDAVQGCWLRWRRRAWTPSRQTAVNLPSRIRMATLYAVAQSLPGGTVLNTSNLSEDWVGYCTIYGDSAGAFSPLGMYTTEEVIALGRVLGLPEHFLQKPPSDGLTGLTDEDNLGFTYHAVNEYVRRGICDPEIKKQIDQKHKASRFKFSYHSRVPQRPAYGAGGGDGLLQIRGAALDKGDISAIMSIERRCDKRLARQKRSNLRNLKKPSLCRVAVFLLTNFLILIIISTGTARTAGGWSHLRKEVVDMPITITLHIFGYTVMIRIKGENRHPGR